MNGARSAIQLYRRSMECSLLSMALVPCLEQWVGVRDRNSSASREPNQSLLNANLDHNMKGGQYNNVDTRNLSPFSLSLFVVEAVKRNELIDLLYGT